MHAEGPVCAIHFPLYSMVQAQSLTPFFIRPRNILRGGVLRFFSDALGLLPIRRRGIQMFSFY